MAGCYSEETSDLRGLHAPTRNNYFYGKLLDVQHFTMEQRYGNNKRWLLNRLGFGSGVMCGLRLEVLDGQLILQPGVALDGLGREIIVPAAVPIDPYTLTDACGKKIGMADSGGAGSGVGYADDGIVTICLAYNACETDMVPVLVNDCDTREGCAPSTIRESFAVLVRPGAAQPDVPDCAVPGLFAPDPGATQADPITVFAKILGRVDEPCPDGGSEPCVVLGDVALPDQGAALVDADVSYTGRRVVLNNQLLFEIILCLWDRVEQCCAGPAPSPAPTIAPTLAPTFAPGTPAPSSGVDGPPATQPPATIAPATPQLQVGSIRILRVLTGGPAPVISLAAMEPGDDPAQPLVVSSNDRPNAIQVRFSNAPVVADSIVAGKTFIVLRFNTDGVATPLSGQIVPVGDVKATGMVRFMTGDSLPSGRYRVTLKGNSPAIMSSFGLPLDGEPKALPSGNGVEGGDFSFGLIVQ